MDLRFLGIVTAMFLVFQLNAQEQSERSWLEKIKDYKIQPVIGIQLWSTYTNGTDIYNSGAQAYEAVDNRLNVSIQRTRFGIKGQPYPNLKFAFISSLDFVGRDILAGTVAGANNGASPAFRVWNAVVEWKISNQNDGFNLTGGYFAPQIGRESITAAFRTSSFDKAWSQNYLRRHLVGTGPGRAVGLNLGGLFLNENKKFGWSYDAGLFSPVFHSLNGNSTGTEAAPLILGRLAFHIGDPEFEKYTTGHKTNYFGERNGLTIAFAGAQQGETSLFKQNLAYGVDWLFNWGDLNFNGDWTFMQRDGELLLPDGSVQTFDVQSNTGYARLSYNIRLDNGKVLEPVLTFVQFNGAMDGDKQVEASLVGALAGNDEYFEIGANYYLNPNLKVSLAYTLRDGDAGDAGDGAAFNNYFFQSGVGPFRRGDWLGLGMVAIF